MTHLDFMFKLIARLFEQYGSETPHARRGRVSKDNNNNNTSICKAYNVSIRAESEAQNLRQRWCRRSTVSVRMSFLEEDPAN